MDRKENEAFVRKFYAASVEQNSKLVVGLLGKDDIVDVVMDEASKIFEGMLPDMAYVETPNHPMATSMFSCNVSLAVYLALATRGVDVHDFGRAMLAGWAQASIPEPTPQQLREAKTPEEQFADFMSTAVSSQSQAKPNEFVYDVFVGDNGDFDWGMNVKSCAICSSFSIYDAMNLVPYMCAFDDVMSDRGKQGLRRTGTIAVGAHQCDFRYKKGGEPQHIADKYPDRIQLKDKG
jgi:hypothetical protein